MASTPFALVAPEGQTRMVKDVRAPVTEELVLIPSFLSRALAAGVGFATGGPAGAVAGAFRDPFGSGDGSRAFGEPSQCPPGRFRVGNQCVDPLALPPGGEPVTIPVSGTSVGNGAGAVIGSFGIPAMRPVTVTRPTSRCMPGAILGRDGLCYMKGSIPKSFRKWRPAPKPPMSAADAKALRRIGSLQKKVTRLAKSANLTCKKK